eukprot:EST44380.1 Hypothetical protein SS50377_15683 [Spironucleus salmonicida]
MPLQVLGQQISNKQYPNRLQQDNLHNLSKIKKCCPDLSNSDQSSKFNVDTKVQKDNNSGQLYFNKQHSKSLEFITQEILQDDFQQNHDIGFSYANKIRGTCPKASNNGSCINLDLTDNEYLFKNIMHLNLQDTEKDLCELLENLSSDSEQNVSIQQNFMEVNNAKLNVFKNIIGGDIDWKTLM